MNKLKNLFVSKIKQSFESAGSWPEQKLIQIWQVINDRITTNSDIKQYDFFFKTGKLNYSSEKTLKDLKSLFGSNTEIKADILANFH